MPATLALVLSLLAFSVMVLAQDSLCMAIPENKWMVNSQGESPCSVASALIAPCVEGVYEMRPLQAGTYYNGPSLAQASSCQCNTVVYSLVSACGACQGQVFINWSTWSGNCARVGIQTYLGTLPEGVSVPGWAYQNVKINGTFNLAAAQNANSTELSMIGASPTGSSISQVTSNTTNIPVTSSGGLVTVRVGGQLVSAGLFATFMSWL